MTALLQPISMTILVDDHANEGLMSEHGFSVWIEASGRRLLFDTGQGPALFENSNMLGVALHTTDILVLSHGHYDHAGGVPLVIESALDVRAWYHPSAKGPRYVVHNGSFRSIGMPEPARVALESIPPGRACWATRPLEVMPGLGITGPIPRITDFEEGGRRFFLDPEGMRIDPMEDDLAMWIHTPMGLVLLVGCSHSGLINTVLYAREQSGAARVHAVIGGFHLSEATEGRVDRTIDALAMLKPDLVVPCHCTGEQVVEKLRQRLGDSVEAGCAGATYRFSGSGAYSPAGKTLKP